MASTHAENGQATSHDGTCAAAGSTAASGRDRVLEDLLDAARQVRTLSEVRAERARLRTRHAIDHWMASAGAGIAAAVLLVAGAALAGTGLVIRLRAAFAEWPGIGELLAGALLVAIALAWGRLRKQRAERALIRRLRARHRFEPHDRSRASQPAGDHAR
jgi:hypothetical protein